MVSLTGRRCAVVLVGAAAVVVGAAGPALAHVEVDASPARALAANATITMDAEAESGTAGISGVRIQLPAGLAPGDFRLLSGPAGWRASGRQQVLAVGGPGLPVGRDLRLSFRVRQLPAARQLVLKTVQTYTDGRQDSWIEVPAAGAPEPDSPAPVLMLAAAAPGATPIPRATAAPTPSVPPTPSTPPPAPAVPSPTPPGQAEPPTTDNSSAVWLFGGAGIGALLLGAAVVAARRRSGPPNPGRGDQ